MEPLSHNPAAAGIGGQIAANGARGIASGTAAGAATTAVPPAGVDEISMAAAAAFAAEGAQTTALNAQAQEELTRAGGAVVEISATYAQVDEAHGAVLS
jgi:uncharacterized protein (DUF2126 family)